MRLRAVLGAVLLLAACSSGDDDDTSEAVVDETTTPAEPTTTTTIPPAAEVTGPVTGGATGAPANAMPANVPGASSYVEEEFFIEGEATAYAAVGELTADGEWTVEPSTTAPYKTRVLVRRPQNADASNGIVVVEWLNVSAGVDADPDFALLHPLLLSEGYTWIGVSAQQTGVGGGSGSIVDIPGVPADLFRPLTVADPERYGTLSHPGDDYSYDIVTQVGQLARGAHLGGAVPDHVILVGESQSAFRLTTYINGVHPVAQAFDGFLVHSRNGSGAPLTGAEAMGDEAVIIRADVDVPVMQVQTETDVVGLGFLPARQPDSEHVVTWEIAGTAHADDAQLSYRAGDASAAGIDLSGLCGVAINTGPQAEVLRAAMFALTAWVTEGVEPPTGAVLATNGDQLVRDERGIVVGGIRTPAVDVPIAVLTGETQAESIICRLFGQTIPFTPDVLAELYPTHEEYVAAVTESADAAVDAGYLLPADRDAIVAEAESAQV
jgi:Alpha/beta hydrolase domain